MKVDQSVGTNSKKNERKDAIKKVFFKEIAPDLQKSKNFESYYKSLVIENIFKCSKYTKEELENFTVDELYDLVGLLSADFNVNKNMDVKFNGANEEYNDFVKMMMGLFGFNPKTKEEVIEECKGMDPMTTANALNVFGFMSNKERHEIERKYMKKRK